MIDCEFDTLILSLVLIWIFYVFNFNLQLSELLELKHKLYCMDPEEIDYEKEGEFIKQKQAILEGI